MDGVVLLPPAILCITLLYSVLLCSTLHCVALLSGVMYAGGVAMALQGSPTHRYFLAGQKTKLGRLLCTEGPGTQQTLCRTFSRAGVQGGEARSHQQVLLLHGAAAVRLPAAILHSGKVPL